ncbi:MAG TPA: hypothetical protein VFU31_19385 [Candidatus Binatia bacterium]|nr:hypothetical protein [Candidatus Binatia bacterium]
MRIDFKAIRERATTPAQPQGSGGYYRTPDGKAQIEWALEPKENGLEFSASGEFDGSGGQCIDEIAKAYPNDRTVQRIAKVWEVYHLNGMQSGTPEQMREIERRRKLAEEYARNQDDASRHFYDAALTQANWHSLCHKFGHDSYYSWECAVLKEAGLYEVPLPEGLKATGGFPEEVISGKRGYHFGERWVFLPIPEDVLKEIASWSEIEQPKESLHEANAKRFLAEHGLAMRITLSDTKPAPWSPSGHHYRITITREAKRGCRLVFDFWGSQADQEDNEEATPYDVLSCVGSDIYTPETFEEFCREFGDDSDSIKAQQTFRRADRFARRLREFFTQEEQKKLSTIR